MLLLPCRSWVGGMCGGGAKLLISPPPNPPRSWGRGPDADHAPMEVGGVGELKGGARCWSRRRGGGWSRVLTPPPWRWVEPSPNSPPTEIVVGVTRC